MRIRVFLSLLILVLWLEQQPAFAGVEKISEEEFRSLAAELAPKVNLFREVWKQDPAAEFYGGTSRDFLYWLKGEFVDAHNQTDVSKIITKLRQTNTIDIKSFIIGESDIDLISTRSLAISAGDFGIRKFDHQPINIFDPKSEASFNEVNQVFGKNCKNLAANHSTVQ